MSKYNETEINLFHTIQETQPDLTPLEHFVIFEQCRQNAFAYARRTLFIALSPLFGFLIAILLLLAFG